LDQAEDSLSLGLRELACRLNLASRNFDKAAENLKRAAQVTMSGEFLRQVVESEGKAVQAAAQAGTLPLGWQAGDCPALDRDGQPTERSRVYLGSDGVMVPHVTAQEKQTRRERVKAKRRRRGRKCRPLSKAGVQDRHLLRRPDGTPPGVGDAWGLRTGGETDASGCRPGRPGSGG
jgi:hypothetical protein